ncbi:MAG: 30S ribosomal protein S16 [Planctomycetota bacterium]
MQRFGRTHRPFYRINAIDQRTRRNGKVIESLGYYNPLEPNADAQLVLKVDRVKHWLEQGASPSRTVLDMLGREGIIEGEMLADWNKLREVESNRTKAKHAVKRAEAAVEAVNALADETDADVSAHRKQAYHAMLKARATVAPAKAGEAEQLAAEAESALAAAQKAHESAKPAEEAPAEAPAEGE